MIQNQSLKRRCPTSESRLSKLCIGFLLRESDCREIDPDEPNQIYLGQINLSYPIEIKKSLGQAQTQATKTMDSRVSHREQTVYRRLSLSRWLKMNRAAKMAPRTSPPASRLSRKLAKDGVICVASYPRDLPPDHKGWLPSFGDQIFRLF